MPELLERLQQALADRYRIERELGAGGMATVYLAHDIKHDRDVALKVLRPELAAVLGAQRFLAEIKITARLDHPHILTLIDSGESDGFLWYVLPYVHGESLRNRLNREQQLPLEDALAITRQVAGALDHAHHQGVIHRDIKPENILFHEGEAMLADFGIALAVKEAAGNRLTETGLSLGTPQYMSPEQATGDRRLDARSDVYSLGAVLYEMLAGEPPVSGPTVQAVIAKLMTERPTRLRVVRDTVPEGVETAVAKALAKTPADRFQSVAEFAGALEKAETEGRGGADAPGRPPWWRSWRIAAALALVAIVAVGAWLASRARGARAAEFMPDLVRLTSDGNAFGGSLSPDGTRLAYVAFDCDEHEHCMRRLMVRDTGGAGVSTLLTAPFIEGASWATGGRFVLVSLSGGGYRPGAYAVPALGGAPRFLSTGAVAGLGSTDTVLVGPSFSFGDTIARFRWMTVSDGVVRDSFVVRGRADAVWAVPAPRGGSIAVVSVLIKPKLLALVRMVDRTGRVLDSTFAFEALRQVEWDGPHWSPRGDAVLFVPRPDNTERAVVLRRRLAPDGRFTGPTDTLMPLAGGSSLVGLTADGTALLEQAPTERVAYALRRSGPGRLDFRIRRLVSATRTLRASLSFDGEWVLLIRGWGASGTERPLYSVIPFEGGAEQPISAPPGERVTFSMTRPVSSGLLFLMRDASRHLRLYEIDVRSGQARDLGPVPDSTTGIDAIPGGGWFEERLGTPIVRVRARPGRPDTTWTLPPDPGRVVEPLFVSSDLRTLWALTLNETGDSLWVLRLPLDGRPSPPPVVIRGQQLLAYDDGSFEYPEHELNGTDGWYRVPAGGTKAVRLGDAPIQGDPWWDFSPNLERCVAVKRVDKPDIYLIRNFARLLR